MQECILTRHATTRVQGDFCKRPSERSIMTVSECKKECMVLSFDGLTYGDELFYPSLNRAIDSVRRLLPEPEVYALTHIGEKSQGVTYDLSVLISDFSELSSPPIYGDTLYTIRGEGRLTLYADSGRYSVYYKKRFSPFAAGDDERTLPLSEEAARILPLLMLSYMLIDDDPEKATYYHSLYLTAAAEAARVRRTQPTSYAVNTNGW